jgi:hypothetical protein
MHETLLNADCTAPIQWQVAKISNGFFEEAKAIAAKLLRLESLD